MRVLVVHAHPVAESFNGALHRAIVAALQGAGHVVDDCDLYAEDFRPVLTRAERIAYHDVGQNLTGIEDHVARLRAAEAVVLCFPTWWYGMPAILKGWFDRVWSPGVAFGLTPGGGPIIPLLLHIRRFAVVTTYGSPWWFMKFYMREPNRAVLTRGIRRLMAPGARLTYMGHYNMDGCTPDSRSRYLARVERAMAAL